MQQQTQYSITWETWQNMKARIAELEEQLAGMEEMVGTADFVKALSERTKDREIARLRELLETTMDQLYVLPGAAEIYRELENELEGELR